MSAEDAGAPPIAPGSGNWTGIWQRRALPPEGDSTLAHLMAADGFDSGFAAMTEQSWADGVRTAADRLGLAPGMSVFEVGCGAGAWLYPLERAGHPIAGIDLAPALVEKAAEVFPAGQFAVADAADTPVSPTFDAVLSFGVFMYFTSLGYAEGVLDRMVAKATHAVGLFDLPDLARREEDLERRIALAGGPEAYAERYAGLDQCYYDRGWAVRALEERGLVDVQVSDQWIDGYANAGFRFNAWGRKP